MKTADGKFGKGNPGRPKGAVNKTTIAAKEAFALAFDELGGYEGMVAWAKRDPDNLKVFYTLYARLIPTDVTTGGKEIKSLVIELPAATDGDPKP